MLFSRVYETNRKINDMGHQCVTRRRNRVAVRETCSARASRLNDNWMLRRTRQCHGTCVVFTGVFFVPFSFVYGETNEHGSTRSENTGRRKDLFQTKTNRFRRVRLGSQTPSAVCRQSVMNVDGIILLTSAEGSQNKTSSTRTGMARIRTPTVCMTGGD